LYSCCVILFYDGSYEAFERTFNSLEAAKDFSRTLVILVLQDKLYNLDAGIFARLTTLPPNVKCVIGQPGIEATLAAVTTEITASGAGIAAFIDNGDTIGTHYLEYIGYFFEANGEKCRTVFTPVLKTDESSLPEAFRAAGAGGVTTITAIDDIPVSAKGAAVLTAAIAEISPDAAQGTRAFADLLAKVALTDTVKGMLTAVSYTSDAEKIEEISETQYDDLVKYCAEIFADTRAVPSIEILKIENHFTDIQFSGVYRYSAGNVSGDLKVQTAQEIADFKLTEITGNFEDRLFPSAEFSFKITPENGAAVVKFLQKRKRITDISVELSEPEFERYNNYKVTVAANELSAVKIAPRAFYKVSVIIPIYNGAEYLKEAFDSVREQTLGFFESIQVIMVNDGSTDGSGELCAAYAEKFPYNVTYLSQENTGVSGARNLGLTAACGKYVAFLDADDKLSPGFLAAGVKYLDSNKDKTDVAAFPIEYFSGKAERKAWLNFRFDKTAIIDLENDWNYSQFSVSSALIRRSALAGLRFNTDLRYSEDAEFMHRLLLKSMNYAVIKEPAYLYRENAGEDSATSNKVLREEWYRKNQIFGKELIKYSQELYGEITKYTQHLFIHSLVDNIVKIPAEVEADIDGSLKNIAEILKFIDDEIINAAQELNIWLKCYLLKLKYSESELKFTDFEPGFYIGGTLFAGLDTEIQVCQIKEAGNLLKLSGYYDLPWSDGIELTAEYNGEIYRAALTENSRRNVYFLGRTIHTGCVFNLEIPLNEAAAVEFFLKNEEEKWAVTLKFSENSGVDNLPGAFRAGKNFIISKNEEVNQLNIEAFGISALSAAIAKYLQQFSGDEQKAAKAVYDEYLRMYTLFGKSRIWLFMDDIMTAGFGAEQMFTYCSEKNDGIDKYFIIGKDTLDGYRLGQIGTVIEYGSSMHKMLYLFAEKIILSDIESDNYNPFIKENLVSVSGSLAKSDIVYIPREIGDMKNINALTKNLSLITVATDTEREYLTGSAYGFGSDVVVKTGLPKFDLLPEEHDYCILIMPNYQKMTENAYDFDFAASEYCKKISDLLCDERLLDASDEFEFEIDFAPHTDTYVQLADYEIDDDIEVIPPTRPRSALYADCALLITDSLAIFDYVYMKRPVIYYPFSDIETKFLDSEMPKFGATAENHEELVDLIIQFMREGCEMPPEYCERVDEFFGASDSANRKRIYTYLLGA
jgi:glycosyltransferase involved in cell wall biosynthesis